MVPEIKFIILIYTVYVLHSCIKCTSFVAERRNIRIKERNRMVESISDSKYD